MYDTYRSIVSITVSELEDLSLDEVAIKFQNSKDREFRNKCFAYVFKNVYPMLLKIHHDTKFAKLTHDDKTEECLCCTLFAMEHWKPDRGQKLSSFINMVVNSCFKTMLGRATGGYKHKVFDNLVNGDDRKVQFLLNSIPYKNTTEGLSSFIKELENSTILNKDEIEYCKNLLLGYKSNKEIAEQMNYLKTAPKFERKTKKFITVPLDDNGRLKYCSQLRNSIKKKLTANNRELFS